MPIVTDKLVGYWHSDKGLNETSWENIAPSSKGKYNAIVTNAPKTVNGAYVNGVSSLIDLPLPTELQVLTPYTVDLRILIPTINDREIVALQEKPFIYLFEGNLFMDIGGSLDESAGYLLDASPIVNKEVALTMMYTPSPTGKIEMYIDGQLESDLSYGAITNKHPFISNLLKIGYSTAGFKYEGYIYSVRLYNKVLTPAEITQNYQTGRSIGLKTPIIIEELESAVSNLSTASAKISKVTKISGSSISRSLELSAISKTRKLSGSSTSSVLTEARIKKRVKMYVSDVLQAHSEGVLIAQKPLESSTHIASEATATLHTSRNTQLEGICIQESKSHAKLNKTTEVHASIEIKSTTHGILRTVKRLTGMSMADNRANAIIIRTRLIQTKTEANSQVSGTLSRHLELEGLSISELTAEIVNSSGVKGLFGTATADSTAEGKASVIKQLSGNSHSMSTSEAEIKRDRYLEGASEDQVKARATIKAAVIMEGTSTARSEATGRIGKAVSLEGTASAKSSLQAKVARSRTCIANAEARLEEHGYLSRIMSIFGHTHVVGKAIATLNKQIYMQSEVRMKSTSADALLTIDKTLQGVSVYRASATAKSTVYVALLGASLSTSHAKVDAVKLEMQNIEVINLEGFYRSVEQLVGIREIEHQLGAYKRMNILIRGVP